MIYHVNDDNFTQEVKESDLPVLLCFGATWCRPCQLLEPVLEEMDNKLSHLKICKMNIDENPVIPSQYNIRSIPVMMLFKSGEMIDMKLGAHAQGTIEKWIESQL